MREYSGMAGIWYGPQAISPKFNGPWAWSYALSRSTRPLWSASFGIGSSPLKNSLWYVHTFFPCESSSVAAAAFSLMTCRRCETPRRIWLIVSWATWIRR